jgi:hypothetical protein
LVLALFLINKIEHNRNQVEFVGNDKLKECLFEGKFLQHEDFSDTHVNWIGKYVDPVKKIEGQYCCVIKTEIEENSAHACQFIITNLLTIRAYFQSLFAPNNYLKSNIVLRYSDIKIDSIVDRKFVIHLKIFTYTCSQYYEYILILINLLDIHSQ